MLPKELKRQIDNAARRGLLAREELRDNRRKLATGDDLDVLACPSEPGMSRAWLLLSKLDYHCERGWAPVTGLNSVETGVTKGGVATHDSSYTIKTGQEGNKIILMEMPTELKARYDAAHDAKSNARVDALQRRLSSDGQKKLADYGEITMQS